MALEKPIIEIFNFNLNYGLRFCKGKFRGWIWGTHWNISRKCVADESLEKLKNKGILVTLMLAESFYSYGSNVGGKGPPRLFNKKLKGVEIAKRHYWKATENSILFDQWL